MSDVLQEKLGALSEGTLDSAGGFTIDRTRERERFELQSRQRPEAWILLAVQAAVRLEAARVDIHVSQAGRRAALHWNEDLPSALLSSDLWLGAGTREMGLSELLSSCWHARAGAPACITRLRATARACSLRITWDKSESSSPGPGGEPCLQLESTRRIRDVGPVLAELRARLALCPLPVTLNDEIISGRTLEVVARCQTWDHTAFRRYTLVQPDSTPLFAAGEVEGYRARRYRIDMAAPLSFSWPEGHRPLPTTTVVELSGELEGASFTLETDATLKLGSWITPEGTAHVGARLPFDPRLIAFQSCVVACRCLFSQTTIAGPSLFYPVRHGVALDPIKLEGAVEGWRVAIAADALSVDLSGFALVESGPWTQLADWIRAQLDWMQSLTPSA